MLIVCPHCASTYDIDRAALQPHGRRMRCAVCRTLWFVAAEPSDPPRPDPAPPPPVSSKQKLDRIVRVGAIVVMASLGGFSGFAISGEWPRWLMPMARDFGFEKRLWPVLEKMAVRLETTAEGTTVLALNGEWVGGMRAAPAPMVEFAVRNSMGEEVARWTDRSGPPKLGAGETVPFRTRFAVPGGDARDVAARYTGIVPSGRGAEGPD